MLPQRLPLEMMQTQWASQIDPLLVNPLASGLLLKNIVLASGANVINHLLSRQPQGWFVTDTNAAVTIYRSQPFNSSTLTLTSSGAATVSLYVF